MEEKAKQTILLHVHFLDFLDFILFFFAKINAMSITQRITCNPNGPQAQLQCLR